MPTPPYSIAHQQDESGVVRVCLSGEFDMSNSADLAASFARCMDDANVRRMIIDMRGTTFMDSSAVNAVMQARYAAAQSGRGFRVANWTKDVRRVFEILELADALERDPDTSE